MKRAYRIRSAKRRGGYLLALEKVLLIERLAYEGRSQREIAELVGVSQNSVKKYFPRDAMCECGKLLVEHKGWCGPRYKKSAARQAVFPPKR